MSRSKKLIILSLVLISAYAYAGNITGKEIMQRVDNRESGYDSKGNTIIKLINKKGKERIRKVISYTKEYGEDEKSIMYFTYPKDVKGVGFLSYSYDDSDKDDSKWLYMPAMKKVRRISGSAKNDYFMGTDFTYDDMGDRSVDDDIHTLLREEELDGNRCWVVQSIPKDKKDMYSKKIVWVRQDINMTVKVDYYDRKKKHLKTLVVSEIKKKDNIWTAYKLEMKNLQKKHTSIIEIADVSYNLGIKDSKFRVSSLERGI